jgi:hypothetical protein
MGKARRKKKQQQGDLLSGNASAFVPGPEQILFLGRDAWTGEERVYDLFCGCCQYAHLSFVTNGLGRGECVTEGGYHLSKQEMLQKYGLSRFKEERRLLSLGLLLPKPLTLWSRQRMVVSEIPYGTLVSEGHVLGIFSSESGEWTSAFLLKEMRLLTPEAVAHFREAHQKKHHDTQGGKTLGYLGGEAEGLYPWL